MNVWDTFCIGKTMDPDQRGDPWTAGPCFVLTQSKGYCLQDRKLHLTPLYRAMLMFGVSSPKETSNTLIPLIYLMPQKLRDTGHTNLLGLWVTFSSILIMIQWTLVEVILSLPLSCKLLNINSCYWMHHVKLSSSGFLIFFFFRVYAKLPAQAQLGNTLGLTLVVLAGIVVFVVSNSTFKRSNTEESEHVSLISDKD